MKGPNKFRIASLTPYGLIAPALVLIFGFMVYPMVKVFEYSFQNYNINTPFYNGFAGLSNFVKILTGDSQFYTSLWVSLEWVVVQVALQLVMGLILALVLNPVFRFRSVARTVVFLPWAVSGVITATVFSIMLNQNAGIINEMLMRIGLIHQPIAWLANPDTAFWGVSVAELWRGIPFFAITLLAALQTIPGELYEAGRVDGAGKWILFTKITLPGLKQTIVLTTLLRVVWTFNSVDIIYNMTDGGPVNKTTTLAVYIANQAIISGNFGYGSALTVIAFIILLIFALVYLKLSGFGKGGT